MTDEGAKTELLGDPSDTLVFPGYEVRRLLGRGGMGEVYLARQIDQLDREVAIKTILKEHQSPYFRKRFLQEGQRQAELHHPHILPIFAAGEINECLYLAMHYARDGSLRERISAGQLSADDSASIVIDLLKALKHAHNELDMPLVHLDIKPENILFDGSNALLSDFGIARKIEQETGVATVVAGDPRYWAPEQQSNAATTGSDIFALGTTFFEMLSGERPPQNLRVVNSRQDAEAIQRLLPKPARKFGRVIARCLQEDPARRPTANEFLEELRDLLRPKRGFGAIHAVLIAALVGSAALLWPQMQESAVALWEEFNPTPTHVVDFNLSPLSSRLSVDGIKQELNRALLTEGTHQVAVLARGFIGELHEIKVTDSMQPLSVVLEPLPPLQDEEYLAFSASFGVDTHQEQREWRDPTLARLVALDNMANAGDQKFASEIDRLETLSAAGDAVAATTLFYAAFEELPVPKPITHYQPALERASREGYALASILNTLYILDRLMDAGETFERNPRAFHKVEELLQRAAQQGLPETAALAAASARITITSKE